jgi:hypothetical protein
MNHCVFSPCRIYRYRLDHVIDESNDRALAFCMLNPSTADENQLDPTLRRCRNFADRWGFGRMIIGNLFAFRATDPADMKSAVDPVGPDNDDALREIAYEADLVVCAWGAHGDYMGRDEHVTATLRRIRDLHALSFTASDMPRHPLYLRGDLKPQPFRARWVA